MRFISVKVHQAIDCTAAAILICAPWIFGFAYNMPAAWTIRIFGILILMLALITRYGLGVMQIIPMPVHLRIDVIAGVLLAVSPWLLGFHQKVFVPHLVMGLLELGAALMTDPRRKDNPLIS